MTYNVTCATSDRLRIVSLTVVAANTTEAQELAALQFIEDLTTEGFVNPSVVVLRCTQAEAADYQQYSTTTAPDNSYRPVPSSNVDEDLDDLDDDPWAGWDDFLDDEFDEDDFTDEEEDDEYQALGSDNGYRPLGAQEDNSYRPLGGETTTQVGALMPVCILPTEPSGYCQLRHRKVTLPYEG